MGKSIVRELEMVISTAVPSTQHGAENDWRTAALIAPFAVKVLAKQQLG